MMTEPDDSPATALPRLGSTVSPHGTRFEVWSPESSSVELIIEAPDGEMVVPMTAHLSADGPTSADSTWRAEVSGVGDGARYRFRVDNAEPTADPASRLQPDGVHGPSAVVDTEAFEWTDGGWAGVPLDDTVLYELHVGTFTQQGTFGAAIDQLDRLVELGVTAVEIMPVAAFAGERNWGYDGVFPFATQASYGGPSEFARFVDAAHGKGLAVLLDVVYNHIGPEGNVLPRYGPYLTDDYSTPWGGAVNVSGPHSDAVRRYFIENAVGWIRDFHLDGLRLDAVHAIVDPTAHAFVDELTTAVHDAAAELGRAVLVTIESSANDPRIVRPTERGGWNCDAVWNDDFHHALRVALTGERQDYYAGYVGASDVASALEQRFVYSGQHSSVFGRRHGADARDVDHARFIVFSQNHDHVGNTPRGLRLLHDAGPADPRLRLAAAAVILSPFTPMLFMGEEYGERAPFPYFIDHGDPELVEAVRGGRREEFAGADWDGGIADPAAVETFTSAVLDPSIAENKGPHRDLLTFYIDLLRIRRDHPVLVDRAAKQSVSDQDGVVVLRRRLGKVSSSLILNFTEQDHLDEEAGSIIIDSGPTKGQMVAPFSARLHIDDD